MLPLDDQATDVATVIDRLASAGFTEIRLAIDKAAGRGTNRACCCSAAELQERFGCIQALSPLPMTLTTFRPTTGYDDVKMVAIGAAGGAEHPDDSGGLATLRPEARAGRPDVRRR